VVILCKQISMRTKLLIVILILITQFAWSKDHFLDLSNYKLSSLPSNIAIDSVIDVRDEKNCIGYVLKGMRFQQCPTYLTESITKYIGKICVSRDSNHLLEHYIIRINKLFISELNFKDKELGVVELNISFISENNNKYYEKFQACTVIPQFIQDALGIPSNNKDYLAANIIKAFDVCFQQYTDRASNNKFSNIDSKETKLYSNPTDSLNYNIQKVTNYSKCIYTTYFDFRDNTPDSSVKFEVEYKGKQEKNSRTATITTMDKNQLKTIWGFSDGKENFVRFGTKFYPILELDKKFCFYSNPQDMGSVPLDVSMAFGAVGSILFSAIDIATSKKIKYNLDLSTGRFFPNDESNKIEGEIIIYASEFNKANFDLIINGRPTSVLDYGTYYVIKFKSSEKEASICVKSNGYNACTKVVPILFNTDLLLVDVSKKGIRIDNPNFNMKKELYSRIDKEQVVRVY